MQMLILSSRPDTYELISKSRPRGEPLHRAHEQRIAERRSP